MRPATLLVFFLGMLQGASALAFPIATPGTEGKRLFVVATQPVVVYFQGSAPGFHGALYLARDGSGRPGLDADHANDLFLLDTETASLGSPIALGTFPIGTQLIFRLFVPHSGYHWFSAEDAAWNPDFLLHARVEQQWAPLEALVSFEESFGTPEYLGGFNDLSFSVTNACGNLAPHRHGFPPGDSLIVCNVDGRSVELITGFTPPEGDQPMSVEVTSDLPADRHSISNSEGWPLWMQVLKFSPLLMDLGQTYTVTYTATDASPCPLSTVVKLKIRVSHENCPTAARRATWGTLKRHYR